MEDTKAGWQVKWDNLVKASRSEGKIVLYTTTGGNVRAELSRAFKAKYRIDLEHVPGRGPDLTNKILTERRAGLYLADVYMGGATTQINVLKPEGLLDKMDEHLVLPEVLEGKLWLVLRLNTTRKKRTFI